MSNRFDEPRVSEPHLTFAAGSRGKKTSSTESDHTRIIEEETLNLQNNVRRTAEEERASPNKVDSICAYAAKILLHSSNMGRAPPLWSE